MRSIPENKLSRTAVKAWRISTSVFVVILLAVAFFILTGVLFESDFGMWPFIATGVGMVVLGAACIFLIPEIRWRRWYYQIDEHEIDLRSGIIVITRTLVPVKRVQHVNTRQGPILRFFNLADVTISTAATTHRIPALDMDKADVARDQISKFARLAKEDV